MAQTQTTSKMWTLNLLDLGKGAVVAAITAVLTAIVEAIDAGGIEGVDWGLVGRIALTAGVGYIAKNWLTPQKVITPTNVENVPPKVETDSTKPPVF